MKSTTGPGPVHAVPTPVDPVSMELQVMQDRFATLRERVTTLEGLVHMQSSQVQALAGGGKPIIASFITGPSISAPESQNIIVCNWDSVLVIVSRPDWFGGGGTPVAGATVKFSITSTTGTTGAQISTGPNGSGTVVAPGGTLRVTTNAQGEALVYVHNSGTGKIVLNSDMSGAWSQDTVINFL